MVVAAEYATSQIIEISTTRWAKLFEEGVRRAANTGQRVLVSHASELDKVEPLAFFARGRELARNAFFWEQPGANYSLVGAGAAHTFTGEGAARFEQTAQGWRDLLANAIIDNQSGIWGSGPILMGGFSFDPLRPPTATWERYPDAMLVLPRVQLTCANQRTFLTINAVLDADSDPQTQVEMFATFCRQLLDNTNLWQNAPSSDTLQTTDILPADTWKAIVKQTADDIKAGRFRKVVLARSILAEAATAFDASRALERLRRSYPAATLFAVARGERCFVGATPERLVQLQGGTVKTMALAGSYPRGATPQDDERLGNELLNSSKNRQEHAVVAETIKNALAKVCDAVEADDAPQLLKLANVQHLYTPITGKLSAEHTILELVEQLHPTPAVGGMPAKAAIEAIREREMLDRGWYASPVGWLDAHGEGEFVVGLRSALLKGNEATLFVGCGIMGDSDPDSEYHESCLKARVMLSALRG